MSKTSATDILFTFSIVSSVGSGISQIGANTYYFYQKCHENKRMGKGMGGGGFSSVAVDLPMVSIKFLL